MSSIKEFRLFHILFCITFLVKGLSVNLLQLTLFLLLPRRLFYKANYYTVSAIYATLVTLADWWGSSSLTVYCSDQFNEKLEKKSFKERQLVVVNHHTEVDWLLCWQLADRGGLLGGSRALAKKSLAWLPVIGWSASMTGDVFLSRSWEKDKIIVKEKVDGLGEQPAPTWLFVFPEGTRFSSAKHKASLEFAASRGLPRLEHHLVPRTKGFALLSEHMQGGLLDFTFVEGPGTPPTLTSLLMGKSIDMRVFVREFSLSSVPKGEKEAGEWLMQLFKEKDEIKAAYLAKDWDKLASMGQFNARYPEKRVWPLIWTAITNIVVLTPLLVLVLKGGPLIWMFALLVLCSAWAALEKMVSVSKIKKED